MRAKTFKFTYLVFNRYAAQSNRLKAVQKVTSFGQRTVFAELHFLYSCSVKTNAVVDMSTIALKILRDGKNVVQT